MRVPLGAVRPRVLHRMRHFFHFELTTQGRQPILFTAYLEQERYNYAY